jgi:hypothetical protein
MNKLLLGLTAFALALGVSAPSASALSCDISGTGPGSTNTCESVADFECQVKNNNEFTVINKNDQKATSGTAVVDGNTDGGNALSGSATNSNGTVIDVKITNGGCVVTAVTQPPVVTPPTTVTPSGGQGEVVTPVPAPAGRGAVTTLPNTDAESAIGIIAGLVTLLGATVAGSRLAVSAYDNLKS